MLIRLQDAVASGTIRYESFFFAYCKKDPKMLAYSDAMAWDQVDPKVQEIFSSHLAKTVTGDLGIKLFTGHYTGQTVELGKVVSSFFDQRENKPAVEIMEAIAETRDLTPQALMKLGNVLAYKYLASQSSRTYVLGIVRFHIIPELGGAPLPCAFASLCDLEEERVEAQFDEAKNRLTATVLNNLFSRSEVAKAALFPCLDEQGKELADLWIYDGSSSRYWWDALECQRQYSPAKESRSVINLVTRHVDGEVPHDIFARLETDLVEVAAHGLTPDRVAESLEKAVLQPVDKDSFRRGWTGAFGREEHRVAYESLFGEGQARLTLEAGEVKLSCPAGQLRDFRQVSAGGENYVVFRVPQAAKVAVGKDLDLKIASIPLERLLAWLNSPD